MLQLPDGSPFVQGVCTYVFRPVTEQESAGRLYIEVEVQGVMTPAIIDTGGVYFVCDPRLIEFLTFDPAESIGIAKLTLRYGSWSGRLYRSNITFMAEQGESLVVDATVFVPDVEDLDHIPEDEWQFPCFIGLHGCLENMRFAVDPGLKQFYFGSLG